LVHPVESPQLAQVDISYSQGGVKAPLRFLALLCIQIQISLSLKEMCALLNGVQVSINKHSAL